MVYYIHQKETNQEIKERGKIMEKKIIYIAYDGERFNSEENCAKYEQDMGFYRFKNDFSLYDKSKKPIPNGEISDSEDIYFIRIINPSKELNVYLENRFRECNLYSPWADEGLEFKDDLYFWDRDYSCWRSWSDEMEKLDIMGEYFQMFTEN